MKKIGILSDTHGLFDQSLKDFFAGTDELWHAGDIGSVAVADDIADFKPLRAVCGNIDDGSVRRVWPECQSFECENISVFMTHIGGYPGRYEPKVLRNISICKPALIVTGHSHILKVMYDKHHDLLHINPGAAGRYGFHKVRTAVRIEIDGDRIRNLEVGEWHK